MGSSVMIYKCVWFACDIVCLSEKKAMMESVLTQSNTIIVGQVHLQVTLQENIMAPKQEILFGVFGQIDLHDL